MNNSYKQVIVVRNDLGMGRGKIAAQASHASLEAYEKAKKKNPTSIRRWREEGMAKVVLKVGSKKELVELYERVKRKFPAAMIKDAARTQLKKPGLTCIGIGPVLEEEIDRITGKLKLL